VYDIVYSFVFLEQSAMMFVDSFNRYFEIITKVMEYHKFLTFICSFIELNQIILKKCNIADLLLICPCFQ